MSVIRVAPFVVPEGSRLHVALRVIRALVIIALVVSLPYLVEPFRLNQLTQACIYAIVIVGLNLLSGFGGQISLGHAGFFGLGAYTTGVLITRYGVSPALSFLVGIALCFVVGAVVALPTLRLKGIYVALVTLAFGLIFPTLVTRFDSLTGGPSGLFGITYAPPNIQYFAGLNGPIIFHYWLAVIGLGLACLVVRNIVRSGFGRGVIALRDREAAAVIMGVDRVPTRMLTFGTSAGIAGFAGGLYAVTTGILTADTFSLLLALYFLAGMVIGGMSSLWGPIFGGFAIYFAPVWASDLSSADSSTNLAGIFFGLIIILFTFALRSGLAGLLRKAAGRFVIIAPQPPRRKLKFSGLPPSDNAVSSAGAATPVVD